MAEKELKPIVESYNVEEEFLYNKPYLFIKGFATGKNLPYTLKALPLARRIHNGQYRKGLVKIDGVDYKLPYVLHVLKVTSTLISLNLNLTTQELDILLTASLLHDAIEDYFKQDGKELITQYSFPKEVYEIVKLISKESGATEYELNVYFNTLKTNKFALLIKLADRSHNVEDLYNMKIEKLHKYVKETRDYIYPLSAYAKANYPELTNGVTILKAKIVSLTELTETLVDMYTKEISKKDKEIEELKKQIEELKKGIII